jgi:hypothetical protein
MMNLATKDQVARLNEQIETLAKTVERLESRQGEKKTAADIKPSGSE